MPRHTETSANDALGSLLRQMLGKSDVFSESTQTIEGHSGRRPDILITSSGRSPVVVEAEYEPARTVEPEAKERLGLAVTVNPRPIEAAIALRYPESLADADELTSALLDARLSYCVFTVERYSPPPNPQILSVARFPKSGWLEGPVADLADMVRLVSVPQLAVDQAANSLEGGIGRVASVLDEIEQSRPAINTTIARLLGMANVSQTRRMAGAIIANAMVFHERVAGMHDNIKALNLVCGPGVANPQSETLAAWTEILKINYWSIFAIGKDILQQLPAGQAARILNLLAYTVGEVGATGIDNTHDLTGRVFQRLIADRKYLATFYTRPTSAALLARLAVAKLRAPAPAVGEGNGNFDWADGEAIGRLRIGDFACGTGALLSAVYEQIAARYEQAGGDPKTIHPVMMEEVLHGCDVLPSAVHITGSTLSGAQPNIPFLKSRLHTLRYGRLKDGSVAIGSLEFLNSDRQLSLSNVSDPAMRTGSAGEETATELNVDVPDEGFDVVIMNPPFTRPGSDWEGSSREEDYIKQYRGLSTDLETQKAMAKREKDFSNDTCAHGFAGIASVFAALAHRKLKPGGVLALVLPLTATSGMSWQKFRQMIATNYAELSILSIVASGDDISFSSDTGMAECLVIARKSKATESLTKRAHFTSLKERPIGFPSSSAIAKILTENDYIRRIEDGPYGGTSLMVGGQQVGEMLTAPYGADGEAWGSVRLWDYSLGQTAYALTASKLWLPGFRKASKLGATSLGTVGKRGLYHRNVIIPFDKATPSPTATYPSLWNHDAKEETRMVCEPDSQLLVRAGMEGKAAAVWATASRAHLTLDFRFNSQPLAAAFTEQQSVGGRAWPNVIFPNARFDYAFALWCNSTLGLLLHWWHSSLQQPGRGIITISSAETLPVLDFRALSDGQLATAQRIFDELRELELQPAYLADADPNRALLDRRVVCDLLGFDEDVYRGVRRLAAKWCAEPSVHGGKERPKDARYVE